MSIITVALTGTFCGCTKPREYRIERESKIITADNDCRIEINYPVFIPAHHLNGVSELNELFSVFPDYEYYVRQCAEQRGKEIVVKGDYRLTLTAPELLSIEFVTTISFDENHLDTVFHSLVINPKKIVKRNGIISTPEILFKNFNRKRLYEYVEAFNERNNKKINLLAYEKGSKYVITWGVTKGKLLLYVGGEGEGFGHHRIEVPLSEF